MTRSTLAAVRKEQHALEARLARMSDAEPTFHLDRLVLATAAIWTVFTVAMVAA
ncbi:hypothetical protein JI742_01790 [Piscinibacter sp. Jin2]|uniref:Uncharacterized protein n=1 Tax=Aquariibacter lacus TaxID=2801332 RepID=A0A9X0XFJ9_9BURK|nr:hypothetical protein [Piscinibacter lacus]MBL0718610.1 hypothetical protein [Piscinibacter lacus]